MVKKKYNNKKNFQNIISCKEFVDKLYEKGYNGLDILDYIEHSKTTTKNKFLYLIYFDKIRGEFRNEKLFMLIINLFFMRKNLNLENILEM